MNILYIDHYVGSISMGMEFRPYYFAREWQKLGHRVRLVGANFSHLRKANPIVKKDLEVQTIDDVEFQWIKTGSYEGNGIARAMTMAEFCGKLTCYAKQMVFDFCPDVIISSSTYPLDTFAGQRMRKFAKNALLIHEIHDMWPLTPIELYGMSPKHPFVVAMQWGENSFCKNSDRVVSVLPDTCDYLVQHGMEREKFFYVPNGIDLSDWENPEPLPELHKTVLEQAHEDGKLIICFFGSHTKSYNIDYLIKAAHQLQSDHIFLAFVGSGVYKEELMNLAKRLGLSEKSYAFLPPIGKRSIPTLLSEIDASYIGLQRNGLNRFGIGMNKLFDAMMGGKPILYAVEASNNLIREYNCGISVDAESVSALCSGIQRLLEMSGEERNVLGQNGKRAVFEHFRYPVLARQFLEVMEKKDGCILW